MPEKKFDFAVSEENSKGRLFPEKRHRYRSDFERDRDRVIHSEAFRRLEGKTQVITAGVNDNFRNRLTHSIEVAQIGRTIAKVLGLNENLTEAVCLAHDLGHPPFGHLGERILNDLMADFGGFEHNRQTLRIVELLEHPYPDFTGLNLVYETRLGLARHSGPHDKPEKDNFPEKSCSLEGQAANAADRIAYNCHDLEDGLRAGVIAYEQLKDIEIFSDAQQIINAGSISDASVRRTRTAKAIIDILASDCIKTSQKNIQAAKIKTLDDVYARRMSLITFSKESERKLLKLEDFLLNDFYMHKTVTAEAGKIRKKMGKLFENLCSRPQLMPPFYQKLVETEGLQQTVCDYIAGMTDRFCLKMMEEK
jgi:dGTPase